MARKNGENRGIRELPPGSGIWWVDIWHEGKRIRKKVGSKSAARATCDRLKTESREGRLVPRPVKKYDPTFRELAEMYAQYAKIHHKRKRDNSTRIRRWLDAFGDKSALSIKPHMVEEIIAKMIDEDYKPGTIARELVILKAIPQSGHQERAHRKKSHCPRFGSKVRQHRCAISHPGPRRTPLQRPSGATPSHRHGRAAHRTSPGGTFEAELGGCRLQCRNPLCPRSQIRGIDARPHEQSGEGSDLFLSETGGF